MPPEQERVEADHISNEPLLRVNVSPFFTSAKLPPMLEDLDFSPTLPPLRINHGCAEESSSHAMIPPLSLNLCDGQTRTSLERPSSWHDGSLHSDPSPSIARIHPSSFTSLIDLLGEDVYNPCHAMACHHEQEHPFLSFRARTPTESRHGFSPYFDRLRENEEKNQWISPFKDGYGSLSPTTMDKKILVTDQDLKVLGSDRQRRVSTVRSMGREEAWEQRLSQHQHQYKQQGYPYHVEQPHDAQPKRDWMDLQAMQSTGKKRQASLVAPEKARKKSRTTANILDRTHTYPMPSFFPIEQTDVLMKRNRFVYVNRPLVPRKIGIYLPAARRQRIQRWLEKRKQRVYHKRIKYDCRKRLATTCPRVKGRFVKKSLNSAVLTPTSTPLPVLTNMDDEDTNKYLSHSSTEEEEEGESEGIVEMHPSTETSDMSSISNMSR